MKIIKIYDPRKEGNQTQSYVTFDGNLVDAIKRASKLFRSKYVELYYEFEGNWARHNIREQINRFNELLRTSKRRTNKGNSGQLSIDFDSGGKSMSKDGWVTIE